MRTILMLTLLSGLPSMAAAGPADMVRRDPDCAQIATVQYLDCEVAVLYSCPAPKGLAGPLIREEGYGPDGLLHFEVDTANGGMIVTGDSEGTYLIQTDRGTLQETPMDKVLLKGKGAFSSKGSVTMFGVRKPAAQSITIKATGAAPVLSGVEMRTFTADVAVTLPEPMGPSSSTFSAYLVPSLGVYLSGEVSAGTWFNPDDTPHRPMAIALPGQGGFDKFTPSFCGGSLSALDLAAPQVPA